MINTLEVVQKVLFRVNGVKIKHPRMLILQHSWVLPFLRCHVKKLFFGQPLFNKDGKSVLKQIIILPH